MNSATLTAILLLIFLPSGRSHCGDSYSNLSHCDCSPEILNCTSRGTRFPLGFSDIQKYGQDHPGLRTLICKGHDIPEVDDNLLGNVSHNNLATLDLSNNGIKRISSGAFDHMKNLKHLVLDSNKWNTDDVASYSAMFSDSNLISFSLNNALASSYVHSANNKQRATFLQLIFMKKSMQSLRSLSLRRNNLNNLPTGFLHELLDLQHLDLSENQLSSVDIGLSNLSKLMTLRLDKNSMTVIEESLLVELSVLYNNGLGTLKNVTLSGNSINCTTAALPLYRWLKSANKSLLLDADKMTCAASLNAKLVGKPIVSLSEKELTTRSEKAGQSYVVLGVVLGLVAVLALIILILNRSFFINKYLACKETMGNILLSSNVK